MPAVDDRNEFFAVCARIRGNELIGAECRSLTGGAPDLAGFATCDRLDRVAHAAYVQRGLRGIARASSFEGLVAAVAATDFDADEFRVDVHDPDRRATRSLTEMAMIMADAIPFGPNLTRPVHRFVLVVGAHELRFGELITEPTHSYRRHDDKPWTTSSSLDSRFARALVNLVPDARSIVDPCCGAGSIVLEAACLGRDVHAVDWKPAMVGMATKNLAHFGYSASIRRGDSRQHVPSADAVVTDLPYGHAIERDEASIRSILAAGVEAAPLGVYVAHADITAWLVDAGWVDVEVACVTKRPGFTRWVHSAHSPHASPSILGRQGSAASDGE